MKKSHPVRRAVLATAATVSGIVLLLSMKPGSDPGAAAVGAQPPAGGQQSAQGGAQPAGGGAVTGTVAQTQYGPVQVRITVTGGKITAAEAVQAPSGGQSTQVTGNAVPKLNAAAVETGSAQIDTVSGATYTSAGYKQSLQSALDQLKTSTPATPPAAPDAPAERQVLTGEAAETQYGPVQVRITVSGGKIVEAETVQAPSGGRSTQVTTDAVPKLNAAAVAAGSARIDTVSGATYTSTGYQQSLQSALDQAGG
ncbi:FMN-binding protein [Streptomyces sp. NPDC048290]|uniref:FMN-binding protein n=1 Tax=Streptomyces sp. NPDC048290 TaxID=3155811 RepID=UPI0034460296